MNIRSYTKQDYSEICTWWESHNWGLLPENLIPSTGFIIDGVCAGFLFKTDSGIAWMEYIISNPKSDPKKRDEGLDALISKILSKAKEDGYSAIFSSISHPKLKERYKKHGLVVGDDSMTNFVKVL